MPVYTPQAKYISGRVGLTPTSFAPTQGTNSLILKVNESNQLAQLSDYNIRASQISSFPENAHSSSVQVMKDLEKGYKLESYIRQAVDKYAEKLVANIDSLDDIIKTEDKAILKYIKYRLNSITEATGTPFLLSLADLARKIIRDGKVYWLKSYSPAIRVPGYNITPISNKGMISGLYLLDAKYLLKIKDNSTGQVVAYLYRDNDSAMKAIEKVIPLEDLYIYTYAPDGTNPDGNSQFTPALGDLRALRSLEDGVLKLVYRYLNPLIHIKTPDLNGTAIGDQSEIDIYSSAIEKMSHDGFFVTGPNVDIKAIGAESQALRAESYLSFFKTRGLAGLGISALALGEGNYVNTAGASALSAQMFDRATFYQRLLSHSITNSLFRDLLGEIGKSLIDTRTGDVRVSFSIPDFDDEESRKKVNHIIDCYDKGLYTLEEARTLAKVKKSVYKIDDLYYGIKAQLDAKYQVKVSAPVTPKKSSSNNKQPKKTNSNA